ncbi:PIR protein CIR protein [Plasmodium vinckei lentum]|uniref:PIR protein CIR protein n=1 Tax=Plasmodium vinckei lentum TaxID=138297 RepID=A0A6V7RU16_PLAVN|nr:PIR protein CIR protein [Plasmodium vinckei lentum]
MDHKQMCEKFIAADVFYDGKNANITLEEIKNKQGFEEYCHNQTCDTRKKAIGALSAYLFMKTRGMKTYGQYDEFFLMWLSDKLFEIVKDEGKAQSKDITLNDAYDKYLKNNIKNGSYWSLLNSTKGLKEANLKHMKDFYKLLNHICKTIVYYKPTDEGIKNLIVNSTNCSNQYLSLYNSVPKCSSYHHLLDNLKDIYDKFRNPVHKEIKKKNPQLAGYLQTFTTPDGVEMKLAINFKTFDFSNQKCKSKRKKKITTSKETNHPASQSLPVSSSQDNTELQEPQESRKINQNGPNDPKTEQNVLDSKNLNADAGGGEKEDPNRGKGSESTNKGDSGDRSVGVQGDQGKSSDRTGGAGGILDGGPSDQGSKSGGSGSGARGGKDSGGGAPGNGGNGGSNDGPKEPGDQDVTGPPGKSNGDWLGNLGMSLNLTSYIPSVSGIYESSKDILTNTANQITSAYNSAKAIAQDTYDKTVDIAKNAYGSVVFTVKDTYTRSTNYISDGFSSITNQLSSLGSFSQLGDNQSGSNSSVGGTDTSNPSPPNPKQPVNPPSPSPPSLPPSVTPPSTQQLSQTPPSPQPQDQPQISSPSKPHSNQTQDKLQITVQNGTSNTLQQPDSNTGTGEVQIMTITKATLLSSSTDPSITGSGITTGIVVKINEKPSTWCIGSNKKCDILGIGIIGISIFVFLAIMYKHILFGSAKNSKKKKSMKRVIKYGDGTRKTQIIIKPYDRNKHLKPIINSVGRKKDPLLNIYKLMQADPVPFINVFFLLIFFVYKKKLNYLEL